MKIDITGRRAIVAGGSRGIGRAIALAFAEAGAGVSICARGAEALAATRDDIARHGGIAHAGVCDLSDAAAVPCYIEEAAGALGASTFLSTTPRVSGPVMTRLAGPSAFRWICWRRSGRAGRRFPSSKNPVLAPSLTSRRFPGSAPRRVLRPMRPPRQR